MGALGSKLGGRSLNLWKPSGMRPESSTLNPELLNGLDSLGFRVLGPKPETLKP